MKFWMLHVFFIIMLIGMIACSGGKGSGPYRRVRGANPWWGYRDYYYERVVVVPKDTDDRSKALPLPEPRPDVPDIGMPNMDIGGHE